MLTELCQELRNWFVRDKCFDTFTIENGTISVPENFLQNGQYYRIIGSVFNDGVHKYEVPTEATRSEEPVGVTGATGATGATGDTPVVETDTLTDEVFTGAIWSMTIPPVVVDLSERIDAWKTQYGDMVSSPYNSMSETFGDYSRSWAKSGSGQGNANSSPSWQNMFASELNRWRKI